MVVLYANFFKDSYKVHAKKMLWILWMKGNRCHALEVSVHASYRSWVPSDELK